MSISVVRTALGDIEIRRAGKGKPILLVHGGHVDCRETIFEKGLDHQEFSFVAPSRPGYGNTPLSERNKSAKGTADLIVCLLNELKLSKVIVIGISAGGLTALELAANYPERVESLILLSAISKKWFEKTDNIYKGAKIGFAPSVESFTWFLYRLCFKFFPMQMTKMMFKALSKYRPVQFTNDEFVELKHMTVNMRSGEGFSNDLDQSIDQQTLSKIDCRVLILHSEYDNSVDLSHAENARRNIKGSKLNLYSNRWGHLLWIGDDYSQMVTEIKRLIYD